MYKYVGKDEAIHDALGKATGQLTYCGDLQTFGMLHMKLLRSPVAHAKITSLDVSRAEALPGVVKVLSFANTPDFHYNRGRILPEELSPNQETLFTDHVRFVGDRIAAVVAQTVAIAEQACSLITFTYQELPAVFTPAQALANPVEIHPADNLVEAGGQQRGDFHSVTQGRQIVSSSDLARTTHVAMELHAAVAEYRPAEDKLTVWTPCQSVFGIRYQLGQIFQMPLHKIRVIKTTMGGSFGSKQETILEPLAAAAALAVKGTVKLVFDREEVIANTMLKHPAHMDIASRFTEDGQCLAMDYDATLDAGAYQTISPSYAGAIGAKLGKVYDIPNFIYRGRSICTNTPVSGSYRSWSSSEAVFAMENHFNQVAQELGMDPIELRRKNIVQPMALNQLAGFPLGNVRLEECLDQGAAAFDWAASRAACAAQPANSRYRRGVGMALGSHTSGMYPHSHDMGAMLLKLQGDGSLIVDLCVHDHGCGTITALRNIIAETMDLDPSMISLKEGDTDAQLYDYGCYGSRTIYVIGRAVQLACLQLQELMAEYAGQMLGASQWRISFAEGYAYVDAQPEKRVSYSEIAYYALCTAEKTVSTIYHYGAHSNPGTGAAHFVQVAVDTYTGLVKVERYLAVHDIGFAINPVLCKAQIGGAVQQGVGIALGEIIKVNPHNGALLSKGLKNYGMRNAYDMPDVEVLLIEDGEPDGPFGAKGVGEVAVVPVSPAVVAAVNHALGSNLTSLPLNPQTILAEVQRRS